MLPPVLNRHRDKIPPGAVYIGRGTLWGNPYVLKDYNNDRVLVLQLYRKFLDLILAEDPELIPKFKKLASAPALLCSCKPALCHGDVILEKLTEMGCFNSPG